MAVLVGYLPSSDPLSSIFAAVIALVSIQDILYKLAALTSGSYWHMSLCILSTMYIFIPLANTPAQSCGRLL